MHNLSLDVISKGEDFDGVAYETAEACIFGLVSICQAAVKEAPTSSVIQGICSAVFLNVYIFLISSFEGMDIFNIIDKETLKIHDSEEFIAQFKEIFLNKGDSIMLKLSRFRAASFLRLLFSYPKYSLSACFELFDTKAKGVSHMEGHYFLRQLTRRLDDTVSYALTHSSNNENSSPNFIRRNSQGNTIDGNGLVLEGNHSSESGLGNCILGLVLVKDLSLKSWIFSRYKKLSKSASLEIVSDVTSVLDRLFESFTDQVYREETQTDGNGTECGQSKYINQYLVPKEFSHQETSSEVIGKDICLRMYDKSCPDNMTSRFSTTHFKKSSSVDCQSSASPSIDSGGSKSMDFDFGGVGDSSQSRSSVPRDLSNRSILSPITRGSSGVSKGVQREKSQVSSMDLSSPSLRSTNEGINCSFNSPRHRASVGNSSTNQVPPYSDGGPAAMDIFAASKQLYLGSLGPDATEGLVKSQFEKFGPINQFTYLPFKGFALIEYRNIMDAIKARANMRGRLSWGAYLCVKFSDMGFGTRRDKDGGSSCHVYVGYVSNQWQRDEIINEVRKVLYKGPRMATHLNTEGALLMEFDAPEEANIAMDHLRRFRLENSNPVPRSNGGPDVPVHAETAGPSSAAIDTGSKNSVNRKTELSQAQPLPGNLSDSYSLRPSHLSLMVSQLRQKYNIAQSPVSLDSRATGNHQGGSTREEQLPTSTLWINLPHMTPSFLSDDELLGLCNLAISNAGSVVRLTKAVSTGSSWFIECNSAETAKILLKNFRDCPGMFFQVKFSDTGKHFNSPLPVNPDGSCRELTSPRPNPENHGIMRPSGLAFQSNWSHVGDRNMPEVGSRTPEASFVDPSHGGCQGVSSSAERMWMYRKPDMDMHSVPHISAPIVGPSIVPQLPVQSPQFRPVNFPPSSWDSRIVSNHVAMNPILPCIMPNIHRNPIPPPFMPASVAPIVQYHENSMPPFGQMFSGPVSLPPMISQLPLSQPDVQPPLHPPQPPLPYSQPPVVPPPPSSPPPAPSEFSSSEYFKQSSVQYKWHGTLSKSGVRYCTIYSQRVDSDICKYSDEMAEPTEWPAKLDMTKRTDFRYVKTTFSNTPTHKREICLLLPLSGDDHKGFQEFITYLRQRDCAGVIKIPTAKSMWARLLFILPYSLEVCSMLSITPNPSLCLVGLVLPKETNFEWA